ncbi:MAG: DNA polymerase domain-containing protein [Terrimicrobiaceae bacterium]
MANEFFENTVLFGADATEGILAVERVGDQEVEVYRRNQEGALITEKHPLEPVLWMSGGGPGSEALSGDLALNHLVRAKGWAEFLEIQKVLKASRRDYFTWNDPATQYLVTTGRTLFKGLEFADLRRLQIDIETNTTEGFDFPNAARDPIAAIALSDSSGREELLLVAAGDPKSEKAVLEEAGRWIAERDPDVIEGHNLFKFDLPYLAARAKVHKLKLGWGRGGAPLASRASRVQIAERTIQYERFTARGRHIVDTFLLAQHYDVATRELDGYGLKGVAASLGVSEPDRVILDGDSIAKAYREGDKNFKTYALQDVRETRAVSAALSQSYFIQARIFPLNYQDVILRGNATKIDSLFLREYLRRNHSIPLPPPAESFEGGLTDIFETGVLPGVWHCDASSLYPSILLAYDITPSRDVLGIFSGLLADLRTFRLRAKAEARQAQDASTQTRLDALQNTFKILINSFYGYLGFAQGHFADFDAARDVAARGRQVLGEMVDWLREAGAKVIEIDTDGVYFQPPSGTTPGELDAGMAKVLPAGIDVEFGRKYRAMFSYKAKNYALLEEDGRLVIKGAALKSRGMEPFLRDYLREMLRELLEGRPDRAASLEDLYRKRLEAREIPIARLARTETLQDSPAAYLKKISTSSRNRSAAFEIALKSPRAYSAGDQIRYYITGDRKKVTAYEAAKPLHEHNPSQPDENLPYYSAKLSELAEKFAAFFPPKDELF